MKLRLCSMNTLVCCAIALVTGFILACATRDRLAAAPAYWTTWPSTESRSQPAAASATAVVAPSRGRIYLLLTLSGWPQTWHDFDNPKGMFVDPKAPEKGADIVAAFARLGRAATSMRVDGVIFTTPFVVDPTVPESDRWRMQFEGRLNGLRAGSSICDGDKIADAVVALRQAFTGEIILYTGAPADDVALQKDNYYCDGYVRGAIGPYLIAKYRGEPVIKRIIIDSTGLLGNRASNLCVFRSIKRCFSFVDVGAEGHPGVEQQAAALTVWKNVGFTCSLTTDASYSHIEWDKPTAVDYRKMTGPVIIAFVTPEMLDYQEAQARLSAGYSIAIQEWQVGLRDGVEIEPGSGKKSVWDSFISAAHSPGTSKQPTPATSEQFHSELKTDLDLERLPSGK